MRTALLAATAAVLFAVAVPTALSADSASWAAFVAPPSACPGGDDLASPPPAQKRAMLCLVNWTRRHAGLRTLRWSRLLADAAGSKADIIAQCGDFSHHPCGTGWPAPAARRAARYSIWGENLYYGSTPLSTPRAAVLAWLESPGHRAILLGNSWHDLGATVHGTRTLAGGVNVSVWVLEVAGKA
jgi:uncharacterized protein YkwD